MSNKLQELTDRLYAEGLSKGQQEGEQILSQARAEAEKLVKDAQAKAERLIADAQKQAEDLVSKANADLKMASDHALGATKNAIENAILAKSVDGSVATVLSNTEFAKEIILAAAQKVSTDNACDLSIVIPETLGKELVPYVTNEVTKAIGKEIEVSVSKKIKAGLTIGPKNGGYFVSLTDETFCELIKQYLRPATSKLLFGE